MHIIYMFSVYFSVSYSKQIVINLVMC